MSTTDTPDYEVFCDTSYYDMWAVRQKGEKRWGYCYHLPSKEEAEGLASELAALNEATAERDRELRRLQDAIAELRGALKPFTHDDLQPALGGNAQGDASPLYGRNKAVLTLGDFRRAKETLRRTP